MAAPHTPCTIWKVPYRRNPFFTGCDEVLGRLHRELQQEHVTALSQPQGISGLGGIGKTQTALEYVYRYQTDYTAIFWVQASSTSTLTSEFVTVARMLGLPERDEQDERVIIEAVLHWLRQQAGWLLILDNVEDLAVVEPFVPKAGRGHILLTTRARSLGALAYRIEVQKMEPETGALFLLRRTSILPLQTSLDAAGSEERMMASKISQVLDGLPLALDQAGAYIKEVPCTLGEYLALYQMRRQEVLRVRSSFEEVYPASVATTWSLSFEKVFDPEDSCDGEGQMGKHAPASRDLDKGLRGSREALMVAGKATPAGDPGETALHHPSSGLDDKAPLGRLGCWRLRAGVRGRAQTPHGLNVPSEMLLDPFTQLSPVMTIAPNEREPGKATQQWLK